MSSRAGNVAVVAAVLALVGCGSMSGGEVGPDAGDDAVDAAVAPMVDAGPEPDFATLPWDVIGTGVNFKDSQNPRGDEVFIGYAGYGVSDEQAKAWMTALYDAKLRDRGVRYVYAVRGPDDVEYAHGEIQNTHLIAHLLPELSTSTHFVAVAGHSSGGWVACELLHQLYEGGLDPNGATSGRTIYYDLDGVESCLDSTIVQHLRNVYFVSAHTSVGGGGYSLNAVGMMMGGMIYGAAHFKLYDASASGCVPSAELCLHVSLIVTKPHDPNNGTPADYADFTGRPVNHWYLDATGF
jgi:hypothetical protein